LAPDLLLQGYAGGCHAARQLQRELESAIPGHMRTATDTILIYAHIYASFQRLEQTVARESLRRTELVSHFIRGFNSITGMMNIVDVGDEEDLIRSKITGDRLVVDVI
jgi:hypothetical protein